MDDSILKDYKYKVDKIERYFSFIMIIIFFATFKGSAGFFIFTIFVIIVLAYYFKFYKNRPSYIIINGDEITVSQGLTFNLKSFKGFDIAAVRKLENKIELELKDGQKIILMKILLSDNNYNEIFEELTARSSQNFGE